MRDSDRRREAPQGGAISHPLAPPMNPSTAVTSRPTTLVVVLAILVASCARHAAPDRAPDQDWRVTGGEPGQSRWSPLDQINRANVKSLQVAWTFHAGDGSPRSLGEIQAPPIVVNGMLYATSPS